MTRPRYSDRCPECRSSVVVPPITVLPSRRRSSEVVADYLCPAGHTWFTGWQRATETPLRDEGETAA
jgi:hypothetical protein